MGDGEFVRIMIYMQDDAGVVVPGKLSGVEDHLDEVDEYFLGDMTQVIHVAGLQKPPEK